MAFEDYLEQDPPSVNLPQNYIHNNMNGQFKSLNSQLKNRPLPKHVLGDRRENMSRSGRSNPARGRYPKRNISWPNRFGNLCKGIKINSHPGKNNYKLKRDFLRREYDKRVQELGEKLSASLVFPTFNDERQQKGPILEVFPKYYGKRNFADMKSEDNRELTKNEHRWIEVAEERSKGRSSAITYAKAPGGLRGRPPGTKPVVAAAAAAVTAVVEAQMCGTIPRIRQLRNRHRRIDSADEHLIRRAVRHALRERERLERQDRRGEGGFPFAAERVSASTRCIPRDAPSSASSFSSADPAGTRRSHTDTVLSPLPEATAPPVATATTTSATTQTREVENKLERLVPVEIAEVKSTASEAHFPYNVNVSIKLLTPSGSVAAWANYTDATGTTFEVPTCLVWEKGGMRGVAPEGDSTMAVGAGDAGVAAPATAAAVTQSTSTPDARSVPAPRPPAPPHRTQQRRPARGGETSVKQHTIVEEEEEEEEDEESGDEEEDEDVEDSSDDEDSSEDACEANSSETTSEEEPVKEAKSKMHRARRKKSCRKPFRSRHIHTSSRHIPMPPPPPLPPIFAPPLYPLPYAPHFMPPWPMMAADADMWQAPFDVGSLPRTWSHPDHLLSQTAPSLSSQPPPPPQPPTRPLARLAPPFNSWASPETQPLRPPAPFFPLSSSVSAFPTLAPSAFLHHPPPPRPPPLPPQLPPKAPPSPTPRRTTGFVQQQQMPKRTLRDNVAFRSQWWTSHEENESKSGERIRRFGIMGPPARQTMFSPMNESSSIDSPNYERITETPPWTFAGMPNRNSQIPLGYHQFPGPWTRPTSDYPHHAPYPHSTIQKSLHTNKRGVAMNSHDTNYNSQRFSRGLMEENINGCPMRNRQLYHAPVGYTYLRPLSTPFLEDQGTRNTIHHQVKDFPWEDVNQISSFNKEQPTTLRSARKAGSRRSSASTAAEFQATKEKYTKYLESQSGGNGNQVTSNSGYSDCSSAVRLKRELIAHVNTFGSNMSPPQESEEELWSSVIYKAPKTEKESHKHNTEYSPEIATLVEKSRFYTSLSSLAHESSACSAYDDSPSPQMNEVNYDSESSKSRFGFLLSANLNAALEKFKSSAESAQQQSGNGQLKNRNEQLQSGSSTLFELQNRETKADESKDKGGSDDLEMGAWTECSNNSLNTVRAAVFTCLTTNEDKEPSNQGLHEQQGILSFQIE